MKKSKYPIGTILTIKNSKIKSGLLANGSKFVKVKRREGLPKGAWEAYTPFKHPESNRLFIDFGPEERLPDFEEHYDIELPKRVKR